MSEASDTFECFGSTCSVHVIGDGGSGSAADAVKWARLRLEDWHRIFTRFEPGSELSLVNADRHFAIPVTPVMAQFGELVQRAAVLTGGLVDGTLLREIEHAGYTRGLNESQPLAAALAAAPERRPARPQADQRWRMLRVDRPAGLIIRPPGLTLDSGGLAKGLFCDLLAESLESHDSFAVDCAGDVRIGGRAGIARELRVASPFDGSLIDSFETRALAAATSGIGRRSWRGADGAPAHHLLDPSTGRPAFTGIVQATAYASTAALAEICAKAALLSGPEAAPEWLPHGGVLVYDDGTHEHVRPGAMVEA